MSVVVTPVSQDPQWQDMGEEELGAYANGASQTGDQDCDERRRREAARELERRAVVIVDCLGTGRVPGKLYDDGSWNCPHCWAAVQAGTPAHDARKCPNPGCFARGPEYPFPVDEARRILARQEARRREEADRLGLRRVREEMAQARELERQRERDAIVDACAARDACLRCALEDHRRCRPVRYVKHRKKCLLER